MKRIWINGRFSWAAIVALVYASVALIVLDYCWRLIELPIEELILYAAVLFAAGGLGLVGAHRLLQAR